MTPLPAGLLNIATVQDELITRVQALTFISLSALRHRLAADWTMVLPGVYLTHRHALTDRQRNRAGLLYTGTSGQLADVTSLIAHGIRDVPPTDTSFLLIPATEHRANKPLATIRRTHRLPSPVMIDGLPHCPLGRSLADAAARIGVQQTARALIADAVQRQLVAASELQAELPHLAGRGAGVARRAINDIVGGARSAPECEFLDLCAGVRGLPPPWPNSLIRLPDGRMISPDALWEDARLIHETNSRRWHADEDQFESTQERAAALTAAGFVVVGSTPRQIRTERQRIARQITTLYRENAGRGMPAAVIVIRQRPD